MAVETLTSGSGSDIGTPKLPTLNGEYGDNGDPYLGSGLMALEDYANTGRVHPDFVGSEAPLPSQLLKHEADAASLKAARVEAFDAVVQMAVDQARKAA